MKKTTNGQSVPWTQKLLWLIDRQKLGGEFSQSLVAVFFSCLFTLFFVFYFHVCVIPFLLFSSVPYLSAVPLLCSAFFRPCVLSLGLLQKSSSTSPSLSGRAQVQPHLIPQYSSRAQQLSLIVRTDRSFQPLYVLLQHWWHWFLKLPLHTWRARGQACWRIFKCQKMFQWYWMELFASFL